MNFQFMAFFVTMEIPLLVLLAVGFSFGFAQKEGGSPLTELEIGQPQTPAVAISTEEASVQQKTGRSSALNRQRAKQKGSVRRFQRPPSNFGQKETTRKVPGTYRRLSLNSKILNTPSLRTPLSQLLQISRAIDLSSGIADREPASFHKDPTLDRGPENFEPPRHPQSRGEAAGIGLTPSTGNLIPISTGRFNNSFGPSFGEEDGRKNNATKPVIILPLKSFHKKQKIASSREKDQKIPPALVKDQSTPSDYVKEQNTLSHLEKEQRTSHLDKEQHTPSHLENHGGKITATPSHDSTPSDPLTPSLNSGPPISKEPSGNPDPILGAPLKSKEESKEPFAKLPAAEPIPQNVGHRSRFPAGNRIPLFQSNPILPNTGFPLIPSIQPPSNAGSLNFPSPAGPPTAPLQFGSNANAEGLFNFDKQDFDLPSRSGGGFSFGLGSLQAPPTDSSSGIGSLGLNYLGILRSLGLPLDPQPGPSQPPLFPQFGSRGADGGALAGLQNFGPYSFPPFGGATDREAADLNLKAPASISQPSEALPISEQPEKVES